jgi:hypothetical protein
MIPVVDQKPCPLLQKKFECGNCATPERNRFRTEGLVFSNEKEADVVFD